MAIERFIPSKMTQKKYRSPWIDSSIKGLIKRRDSLYFSARKSSSPDIKSHYKRFRAHVQKVIRNAYWKHISGIFSFDPSVRNKTHIATCPGGNLKVISTCPPKISTCPPPLKCIFYIILFPYKRSFMWQERETKPHLWQR